MRFGLVVVCLGGCGRTGFAPLQAAVADASGSSDGGVASIAGLVVWYPFDEATFDGVANDATGGGRHARCATGSDCPAPAPGRVAGAASFNGMDSRFRTPYDGALGTSTGFTIAAFAQSTTFSAFNSVASKPFGTGTSNTWHLHLPATQVFEFKLVTVASGDERVSSGPVEVGRWYHVAGTYDGAVARLYLDGVEVNQLPAQTLRWDSSAVYVGADENSGALAGMFDGLIDDFRLYNRALTPAEVAMLAAQ